MNDQDYIEFGKLMYHKNILPKDLNISSRQVSYWKSKKLLPNLEYNQHGKMNILEAIWMSIIKELSDIGIKTQKLEQLSKDVWIKPRNEKYADEVLKENIKSKRKKLSKEAKATLEHNLNDEILMNTLRGEITPFTDMVKSCLTHQKQAHGFIYIPETNEHKCLLGSPRLLEELHAFNSDKAMITIPILKKVSKMMSIDMKSSEKDLEYLSSIENQIRNIVMFKRPKLVEIAFDDDHIKTRKITEKHVRHEELADYFTHNKIPKGTKLLIDVRSQENYKLTLITK
jgi:DNA-binding transcriptional MerR regulator